MIELDGQSLSISDVAQIARDDAPVGLSPAARKAVAEGHDFLQSLISEGRPIYGITTGFGALDGHAVSREQNRALQHNLLKSHSAGVGAPMAGDAVRALMAIRANVLASGATGVSPETVDALIAMINAGVIPHVPERGSVGACGDLAPLAHMALPLIGLGQARLHDGPWEPGQIAMKRAGIAHPAVEGRDGIALINGTEQTTGIGCLAVHDARRLVEVGEAVSALTMEALGAVDDAFDRHVALWKPHPGQIATSDNLRRLTEGSTAVLPPRPSRLRDALSLRCIPQVMGAARDAVEHAATALEIEINSVNDNPLFGVADDFVTSNSGNFHGQRAAEVLDYLANAMTSVAVMSERRSARLIDPHHNGGLPAFLIHPAAAAGANSGFMIAQYTAASLVAELRMRSVPASIQSVPTCINTEDHVPMAPLAARRAAFAVDTACTILAIEALLAAQAADLRGLTPAPALAPLHSAIRDAVPAMVGDRVVGADIDAVQQVLARSVEVLLN
ncbi:histidine ammonia-lyase [Microbaculum marinum]|uniref:Histidine ammonia-lyase n=1 Tax=Microbaculum marinum TaxID=1764581 RepID=A0AAW9RW22_9HYPH